MNRTVLYNTIVSIVSAMVLVASVAFAVPPVLTENDISWQQSGSDVTFTLVFHNPDANPSDEVTGALNSQEFGAFLENIGVICNFTVPPIPPGGMHEVMCTVPLSSLPQSAQVLLPPAKAAPGGSDDRIAACPGPNWFGNVDVIFGAGGQVNAHLAGNVPVCPTAGPTYIHLIVDNCTPGASWSFANVCPNWTVSLVSDAGGFPGGPAPNPLPGSPPPFDGWICISANAAVPIGSVCCFDLNLDCAGQMARITVWAEACDWATVSVESRSWSAIKSLFHDEK